MGTTIEYVTHASLLFRRGDLNLLTDPFYWFDPMAASVMVHFPPRELKPADLGPIRFMYSSHIHPDHSHPETLAMLKEQVSTVLLPGDRPGLVDRYRTLGYSDLRILGNGETVDLAEGLKVTSYWSGNVDTCLVVELGETVAIHLNDCLPTTELVRKIAGRHRIDYAFMLYTSAQDLYPFLLPHPEAELQELARKREGEFLADQIDRLKWLKPRFVVPYSMTMTYYRAEQRHLNGYNRLIPPQFAAQVEAALPTCKSFVVHPGDVIDTEQNVLVTRSPVDWWGKTLDEYLANVARYADSEPRPPFDPGRVVDVEAGLRQHLEAFAARSPDAGQAFFYQLLHPGVKLQVEGSDGRLGFYLDMANHRVTQGDGPAVVDITVPACIVSALLAGFYDPYSLLFMHRTRFLAHSSVQVGPVQENTFYIMAFLLLLCDDPWEFLTV